MATAQTPAATPGPKIESGFDYTTVSPERNQFDIQNSIQKQHDAMSVTSDALDSRSPSIRQRNNRSGFKADISRISSFQSQLFH